MELSVMRSLYQGSISLILYRSKIIIKNGYQGRNHSIGNEITKKNIICRGCRVTVSGNVIITSVSRTHNNNRGTGGSVSRMRSQNRGVGGCRTTGLNYYIMKLYNSVCRTSWLFATEWRVFISSRPFWGCDVKTKGREFIAGSE